MKTIVVNVPDRKENFFIALFKKHRLKPRVLQQDEDEDLIAKWIDEVMESEDVPEKKIFEIFRKYGIKV